MERKSKAIQDLIQSHKTAAATAAAAAAASGITSAANRAAVAAGQHWEVAKRARTGDVLGGSAPGSVVQGVGGGPKQLDPELLVLLTGEGLSGR